jgi:hypothetical protein
MRCSGVSSKFITMAYSIEPIAYGRSRRSGPQAVPITMKKEEDDATTHSICALSTASRLELFDS